MENGEKRSGYTLSNLSNLAKAIAEVRAVEDRERHEREQAQLREPFSCPCCGCKLRLSSSQDLPEDIKAEFVSYNA